MTANRETNLAAECEELRRRVAELEAERRILRGRVAAEDAPRPIVSVVDTVRDVAGPKCAEPAHQATAVSLRARNQALECLYGLARLHEAPGATLEAILGGTVALLPATFQFPDAVSARIEVHGTSFATPGFARTASKRAAPLVVNEQCCGQIEVCYREPHSFLPEEEELLGVVAERIGRTAERLQAVDRVRRSEERLRMATGAAGIGIWDWDIVKNDLVWDDRMYELYGVARTSFAGAYEAWLQGVHPDDVARCDAESQAARAGKEEYRTEFRVVWPDGTIRYLRAFAQIVRDREGHPLRMVGTNFDVTDWRLAQKAVFGSEVRYRTTLYGIGDAVISTDAAGRVRIMNPVAEDLTGWTEAEAVGKALCDVFRIIHEESRATVESPVVRVLREGEVVGLANHTLLVSRDGCERPIADSGAPVRDEQGRMEGVVLVFRDQTEERAAQQALQASLERYAALLAAVPDIVMETNTEGVYAWANDAGKRFFGDDVIGRHSAYYLVEHEQDASAVVALHFGDSEGLSYGESWQRRCDGENRLLAWWCRALKDKTGRVTGGLATGRDITELKRNEADRARLVEQLHHAQKMEAIGTLAGGVAHDFNNILGGVLSGLSLLELELGEMGQGYRADVQDMIELVQRGADLAKQLLGLSRRGKYDVRPLDVAAVVQKTATMFGRTRRDIVIEQDFSPEILAAIMDYAQLEQVLLNLFLNAAHAMPGGGRLMLRIENATVTPAEAEPVGIDPGRYIQIVVADTGTGIDAATLPRIFEPFFTTKGPGHGSGLGLASVYGIIKNHGGSITVDSAIGKGTAFTILVPATDKRSPDPPAPAAPVRQAHGTILIVDDEEQLLRIYASLLRTMGYEVLTASSGPTAVAVVREHHARISLVILDLTMPGMSGASTFDAIREISPAIKVLLASGYSVDGHAQELLRRGCNGFIQKPFDATALCEKIRSLG